MAPAEPENDAAGTSRSLTWRLRRIALVAFDACCWVFALFAAMVLRYELELHQVEPRQVALLSVFAVAGVPVVGTVMQVYRGRHCIGTVGDAISVSAATAVLGVGLFVPNILLATPLVPRTVPLVATLIALVLAVGMRLLVRLSRERWRRVSGVGVRGTHADLAAVAAATRADQLSIYGTALLDSPDVILADIRDAETVNAIFKERRPDVVFHGGTRSLAAADLRNSDDSPPGAPCHGQHLPCTSASF